MLFLYTKYTLTHLLSPWSIVLLEKLTDFQLVKKFPAFYGTRRLITAVTSPRHLSLSWASSIHSTPPHPTSWRSILILSFHLRLGLASGLFPSGFHTENTLPYKTKHGLNKILTFSEIISGYFSGCKVKKNVHTVAPEPGTLQAKQECSEDGLLTTNRIRPNTR